MIKRKSRYATLDMLKKHPEWNIVDLGCGKGRIVNFVSRRYGIKAVGVDIVPKYIQVASKLASKYNLANISFNCMISAHSPEMNLNP